MDSKGGSLPLMPEPLSPVSMKQPPEPLSGRKGRGDMGADPALLMDKAAVQLAATLQDSVLQKMTGHNHSHERLKDLTSRVLNGDQDKLPKMCGPEPPTLKGAEAPPSHGSPQRKGASPELKLKITRRVANGKSPRFEPCCAEGPNLAMAPDDVMLGAPNKGKDGRGRKKRPVKPKPQPKPGCSPVPAQPPVSVQPEESSASANKVPVPLPEVKGTEKGGPPLQICFSVGDVVWTKVSGYPWWPCIVTTDPELNEHFKQKQKVNSRTGLLYHVQYFGDAPERGYIFEKSMVSFNGEEQYQELCQGSKPPASRLIHREQTTPSVPRKLRGQWNMGIAQAKQAASMALEDRMAMFTFVYDSDGPHLNPRVLEELRPPPAKASREKEQEGQEASRLGPPPLPTPGNPAVQPAPTPDPKHSTSAEKKAPTPKTKTTTAKQGRRKTTASPLKKQADVLSLSKEGPQTHQSLSQDPATLTAETDLLESQKKAKSKLKSQPPTKRVRKNSRVISPAAPVTEPPKKAPKMKSRPITEESKSKGLKAQKKSFKRALDATEEEKEQQPKKKRKLGKVDEKQKAPASDSSSTTKQRKTKKMKAEIKKGTKGSKASLSEANVPEKPKRVWKRKQDSDGQSAPAQPKKRRSPPIPEPEGSGSEGRPESPSDSFDGTKKNGGAKKESVCQVCESAGEDVVPCEGQCCGTFHPQCLGLALKPEGKLLCPECSSGAHPCFSCKRAEGEVRRCGVQHCGKFYHEACARLSPLTVFDNKGFRCPLHTCLNCHYSCRSKLKSTKGKMMRCVRCPVAYHTGDLCVAAGSEMLSPNAIVCTNHFAAKKGNSQHSHVNVCWCFVCSKGGRLLCCESCPAAFHPDCLNIAMPDGSWFCNDCRAGKKPKYNDIIWVKLGLYRWWPAEIRHPRNIPTNIQHLRHEIGEFPVFFFGSKDYFWTHQGRVFPYIEGDRGYKHSKTGIGKIFKRALLEAEVRFKEIKTEREAKETQENNKKPSPYKYIKINKPYGKVQVYTADVSEIPKCNCKPSDEKPCGFESECLNRMLMYECHPQVCPSGERCCNQDFTKRLYPETKVIRTAGKGWGLLALRDVKKGEFVNEYVGELIDEEECRARIKYAQDNDITHFYMLTIYKDRIIDAGPKGNYSRFMNHSCQPNCETQKWTVNGDTRVGLFAVCDIPAGTELTFNYNLDCLGNEKTVCRCGAPNCSGFLGDRPKNSNGQAAEPKGKKVKKKVKKRRARSEGRKPSEDECFRCGDGGQLVLCDKKSCTKAYHLSCLDRTKRPFGRWDCPWHHCDVCGKNSEAFCQLCPNSFCKAHQEGALRLWPSTGQLCCQEHEEPEAEPPEIPRPPKGSRKGQEG